MSIALQGRRSGVRRVPLDAATIDVLEAHRQQQDAEAAQARAVGVWTASGLVFTREDGRWLRPDWVSHEFQRMISVAGVPALRLHDLRHTSASLALAAGVPMKVVSARLGHSSLAITADLYTHVSPAVADEAADRIGSLVADEIGLFSTARTGNLPSRLPSAPGCAG